jgi:hypothetical protein
MAALECVAREVSHDERATLGEIIQRHGAEIGIPKPLDTAIERMWGYALQRWLDISVKAGFQQERRPSFF